MGTSTFYQIHYKPGLLKRIVYELKKKNFPPVFRLYDKSRELKRVFEESDAEDQVTIGYDYPHFLIGILVLASLPIQGMDGEVAKKTGPMKRSRIGGKSNLV
jgi:hypothetical protein